MSSTAESVGPSLHSLQSGTVAPLGPNGVRSGFVKRPVLGSVQVQPLGLVGDEQADLTVHGGPEKAVYGYARRHYASWCREYPEHAHILIPGAFGENLTIDGLDEDAIMIGDVHAIGSALLQVCQPRQPCYKLALHFGDNRLPKAMVRSGRAGWYYRVLQPGALQAGDEVRIVERPRTGFDLARLIAIINGEGATPEEIELLSGMQEVAAWVRQRAQAARASQAPPNGEER